MPEPVISVVMPAYNAAHFLEESIASVIRQTFSAWELLIVDDGSTDNSKEMVLNFCLNEPRIKYFYQQHSGQSRARNYALENVKTSYVAFLDADDVWMAEKLEIQLKQIEEEKADLVFSESYSFSESIHSPGTRLNAGKGAFSGYEGLKSFLELNRIPTSTVLLKTDKLKKINGFVENVQIPQAEDYHVWLQLLMLGNKLYGSEMVLGYYRTHPQSISSNDKLSVKQAIEVLQDLKGKYRPYRKIINKYQRAWFIKYHYLTNEWETGSYRMLIKKNCLYLATAVHNVFFQVVYHFFGFHLTRRVINKIVNSN